MIGRADDAHTDRAEVLRSLLESQDGRVARTLNLVASENLLSPLARRAIASDLAHRYCIPPEGERHPALWDYPNQRQVRAMHAHAQDLVSQVFGAARADVRPLSGNNAALITLMALRETGRAVASVPADCGGHFATAAICDELGTPRVDLPYDRARGVLDVAGVEELASRIDIGLVLLDASTHLFPHPVRDLRSVLGSEVVIAYDASHTMGLIAGSRFDDPLADGADLLQGSTHKSFFGPQKALYAFAHDDRVADAVHEAITPLFVSNSHSHHVAALAVALAEALEFGPAYADMVVGNARTLGRALHERGRDVLFAGLGATESHQVVWSCGPSKDVAVRASEALEAVGLHANLIRVPFRSGEFGFRLGTAELTRRGMGPDEIVVVAGLLDDAVDHRRPDVERSVVELSSAFSGLAYCFEA